MQLAYSFIIPIYNRPEEIRELLDSLKKIETALDFEVVIIEDGSTISSEKVVNTFKESLDINYVYKSNSGPGDSRNYGMKIAKGNYFIILDSDCILPPNYLTEVDNFLKDNYTDCFGGPDAAHSSFTNLQKAINFAMTSFISTGGIRGRKNSVDKFQPRSFNMGISKAAFEASKGFGAIHPGEDPDLSIRLNKLGFKTMLIESAFVYHKRRISWSKFYKQVNKFGLVRPILNKWHPSTKKITFWFPTLFSFGFMLSIVLLFFNVKVLFYLYVAYYAIAFIIALITNSNLTVSILALIAVTIQFFGYGYGFLKSTIAVSVLNKDPKEHFPELFFK